MCKEFDDLMKNNVKMGVEKALDNRNREIIANAIAQNLPLESVADLLKLPIDAVKQIAAQCKAEATACL